MKTKKDSVATEAIAVNFSPPVVKKKAVNVELTALPNTLGSWNTVMHSFRLTVNGVDHNIRINTNGTFFYGGLSNSKLILDIEA